MFFKWVAQPPVVSDVPTLPQYHDDREQTYFLLRATPVNLQWCQLEQRNPRVRVNVFFISGSWGSVWSCLWHPPKQHAKQWRIRQVMMWDTIYNLYIYIYGYLFIYVFIHIGACVGLPKPCFKVGRQSIHLYEGFPIDLHYPQIQFVGRNLFAFMWNLIYTYAITDLVRYICRK